MSASARRSAAAAMALAAALALPAGPTFAQSGDAATVAELRRQLEAMQRRLDQLERRAASAPAPARRAPERGAAAGAPRAAPPSAEANAAALAAAQEARAAAARAEEAARAATASAQAAPAAALALQREVPGLAPPDTQGREFGAEEALRSDLPGIAFRVPGTDTQVRLYGFAKLTSWTDLSSRNQTDAPPPSTIPLRNSPQDREGGDFGATARFSRFGVDTRTLTRWGTLETRLEGDFGGGSPTSSNAVFRLRQAWAELGTPAFRVLIGQANSLWNEGMFETLIDATNLNQSFIRQAQLRVTGRLAPGLIGQVSLEAPETAFVSGLGTSTPASTLANGATPAFNSYPDLHGRLTYRPPGGWELGLRAMLRGLEANTKGGVPGSLAGTANATGWGFAAHARLPMRALLPALGPDELIGMGFYGEGIGRYFFGNSQGIDAVSNLGLAARAGARPSLEPIPIYGATVAYRRFWMDQLRSNFAYSWSRQDVPGLARDFAPGSTSALALNQELQQVFANLIWSPFATRQPDGTVGAGWLDIGLEYLWTRRDVFGGGVASGPAGGVGHGIGNRILFGAVARF